MAFTQTLRLGWSQGGNTPATREVNQTGSVAPSLSQAIPNASTDLLLNFACDKATLQMFYLVSSQDLTLKTNSATVPGQTWALKAGVPLAWHVDAVEANPLAVAITALFATNASGATAQLEVRALHN